MSHTDSKITKTENRPQVLADLGGRFLGRNPYLTGGTPMSHGTPPSTWGRSGAHLGPYCLVATGLFSLLGALILRTSLSGEEIVALLMPLAPLVTFWTLGWKVRRGRGAAYAFAVVMLALCAMTAVCVIVRGLTVVSTIGLVGLPATVLIFPFFDWPSLSPPFEIGPMNAPGGDPDSAQVVAGGPLILPLLEWPPLPPPFESGPVNPPDRGAIAGIALVAVAAYLASRYRRLRLRRRRQ